MGKTILINNLNELSIQWKAQYEHNAESLPALLWRLDENGEIWLDHIKVCRGGDIGGTDDHAVTWDRIILSTYYGYLEIQFAFPAGKKVRISEVIYHRVMEGEYEKI